MSDETLKKATQPSESLWTRRETIATIVAAIVAVLTLLGIWQGAWADDARHKALLDHQVTDHETRVQKMETEQRLQAEYLIRMDGKIDRIGDRLGLDLRRKPFGK